MGQLAYLRDVVTLELNRGKCVGCGTCLLVCPHAVFNLTNDKVDIERRDACMECGACSRNCPTEAISVKVGVGCASAVINSVLGRKNASCCCSITPDQISGEASGSSSEGKDTLCC